MNKQKAFPPSMTQGGTVCERRDRKLLPRLFVVLAGSVFLGGLVPDSLGAAPVSTPQNRQQDVERNSTITNNSQSIFIGEDEETGDRVIRVTPPRQPATQQPYIPYVIPEVSVPWQPGGDQYPPGWGNNGGMYPPQRPDRPLPPGSSFPQPSAIPAGIRRERHLFSVVSFRASSLPRRDANPTRPAAGRWKLGHPALRSPVA